MNKDNLIALGIASIVVALAIALLSYAGNPKPKMAINYNDSHGVDK